MLLWLNGILAFRYVLSVVGVILLCVLGLGFFVREPDYIVETKKDGA